MTDADLSTLFADLDRDCLPHLSVNGVVFGAHAGALQVLLIRWAAVGQWALPGAYVRRDEGIDAAAARMVHEHVGLRDVALRQFHTFGARDRVGAALAAGFRALGVEPPPAHWALGRVVSVGYVALVDADVVKSTKAFVQAAEWTWASTYAHFAPHEYTTRWSCRARGIESEFEAFVRELRRVKDQEEFDRFMQDFRNRTTSTGEAA